MKVEHFGKSHRSFDFNILTYRKLASGASTPLLEVWRYRKHNRAHISYGVVFVLPKQHNSNENRRACATKYRD